MGLKAAYQVGADLRDHFLQLIGALVDCQLHQGVAHVADAPKQRHQKNDRQRDGQKIIFFAFSLLHGSVHLIHPLSAAHGPSGNAYRRVM